MYDQSPTAAYGDDGSSHHLTKIMDVVFLRLDECANLFVHGAFSLLALSGSLAVSVSAVTTL